MTAKVKDGVKEGLSLKARFDDGFNNGAESVVLKMLNRGKSLEDIKADKDLSVERIFTAF